MHNAPERIYLQIDPDGTDPTEEFLIDGATWCQDKINESDVEYVRADEIDRLRAEVAKLQAERDVAVTRLDEIAQSIEREDMETLRKDAQRYRWISQLFDRKWNGVVGISCGYRYGLVGNYRHAVDALCGATLDAAIDAALAKDSSHE